jgi:hypothetical protein
MWDETEAGTPYIALPLCGHTPLYVYTRKGQNLNSKLTLFLPRVLNEIISADITDLKLMISGYSFLFNDSSSQPRP